MVVNFTYENAVTKLKNSITKFFFNVVKSKVTNLNSWDAQLAILYLLLEI